MLARDVARSSNMEIVAWKRLGCVPIKSDRFGSKGPRVQQFAA